MMQAELTPAAIALVSRVVGALVIVFALLLIASSAGQLF
jgi:hypothetical protein